MECVYFVRACFLGKIGKQQFGFIHWKIGRTFNIERRLMAFQTASPVPIELIGTLACADRAQAVRLERDLHKYFGASRNLGEWFTFDHRKTKAVYALLNSWPIGNSVVDFMDAVPEQGAEGMPAPVEAHHLITLGTLLEERKRFKARLAELRA